MEPRYREAIHNASAELCQVLMQDVPMLLEQGLRLDALVREVLRAVSLALLSALYQGLCRYLVKQATDRGLTVQMRSIVRFKTLYGVVEVESPYLRSSHSGESARPMKDILGVEGEQYSESVQRALADFGSEKSFARAREQLLMPGLSGGPQGKQPQTTQKTCAVGRPLRALVRSR